MSIRYLFDLTTAAHWSGHVVGIVRVERELGRRARRHLGKELAFSLYDRSRNLVVTIDDDVAQKIIDGSLRVNFAPSPGDQRTNTPLNTRRRQLRRAVLRNAALYQFLQRGRGRYFSREEIQEIQAAEFAGTATAGSESESTHLSDLPHRIADLDSSTCIISGGLDWQYKDLRALWRLKQKYRFRYSAIVYDLIPVTYPHFVVPGYVELLTEYFGELLWLADQTMCISETTRRDWLRHADDVGAQALESHTFPLGCDIPTDRAASISAKLPQALQGKRFALYVSTIEPRKNHRVLYEAWDECIRTKQIDPDKDRLVFVGRRGWATDDLLREISTNSAVRGSILILNDVADDQLKLLYEKSAFILFPSQYEGYGLALAEALADGKFCIASSAGSLSEVGGDLVLRIDPSDTLGWAAAIARFLSAPSEVAARESRIREQHHPVTWDEAAATFFRGITNQSNDHAPEALRAERPFEVSRIYRHGTYS